MDPPNISPQLDRLDDEIDNLEEALQPFLSNISDVANKLPLLDKAKLFVLVTYSIESMLFSSLRLNGVDAKEHAVFKELTRVRQYFDKIKNAENPPQKPERPDQTLNKEAAIRFIKADLSENKDKLVNTKLSEMIAKERAKAALKAAQLGSKRKAEEPASADQASAASNAEGADLEASQKKKRKEKKDGKKHKDKKGKRRQQET
ncbi:Sas10/Utp3/C1D family-domain-containing protein [Annulohypoxylon maeteangense]|uniref:Sas10/Utp3/C1D family-domain-containing protein n=1 Tax=Annulohypoxylon maeteangense TaxID=1927788 RepID=UPI0020074557|nr:Sas10/Utp3/C1D family-domain-containing protein [Annulohypoxylon maeteangense]KAI0883837.1 Sas10/Utp3/C1D family-domain-containing protein [Annulohypoxylon maeteangense]